MNARRLRREMFDRCLGLWVKKIIHIPTLGSTLAPFMVLMSSPRLFLSPFIFQFPPTKNFLVMIAFCCCRRCLLGIRTVPKVPLGYSSSRKESGRESSAPSIYKHGNFEPSPPLAPLVYGDTPANASPHLRKGKSKMSCCVHVQTRSCIFESARK